MTSNTATCMLSFESQRLLHLRRGRVKPENALLPDLRWVCKSGSMPSCRASSERSLRSARAHLHSLRCATRRELSNANLVAKFGFDTAKNEPYKVCWIVRKRSTPDPRRAFPRRGRALRVGLPRDGRRAVVRALRLERLHRGADLLTTAEIPRQGHKWKMINNAANNNE